MSANRSRLRIIHGQPDPQRAIPSPRPHAEGSAKEPSARRAKGNYDRRRNDINPAVQALRTPGLHVVDVRRLDAFRVVSCEVGEAQGQVYGADRSRAAQIHDTVLPFAISLAGLGLGFVLAALFAVACLVGPSGTR